MQKQPVKTSMPASSSAKAHFVEANASAHAASLSLLSPSIDVLMIGGLSLVCFAIAYLFVNRSADINQISWAAFYLAMLINNPHFMASYAMLYWDKRHELIQNKRFFWAALVVPACLLTYFAGAMLRGRADLLGYAVNAMFFLVGWHYVKQIYGCVIVTSARRAYYLTKTESWALKLNLYPVWFVSFINGNQGVRNAMHYGISYDTFNLPAWLATVNYAVLGVSLVGLIFVLLRKWVREGKLPGLPAVCALAAIYVWYLPTLYHVHFWYLIPGFHSLQYMLFVLTLKRNQYRAQAEERGETPEAARRYMLQYFLVFLAVIIVTAAVCFDWLPNFLNRSINYDRKTFGNEIFMYLFITFINIHHYFIDNVLWRRDNPQLKRYLL